MVAYSFPVLTVLANGIAPRHKLDANRMLHDRMWPQAHLVLSLGATRKSIRLDVPIN